MAKFVVIGERLSTTAPAVNKAFMERDPEPIIKRAKQQLDAGATYLDVNIGPAENDGEDLMKWAVQLLQSEFDNVPLALDTTNKKAIEAGISVYNRSKGKPIVNSADAGDRISNIDLAAANDAIVIALCSSGMIASDNDERMMHCQNMLERGLGLGMEAEDLWFDPLFVVVKGMQEKTDGSSGSNQNVLRYGTELHRRTFQQQQRYAENHPSDHGFRSGSYGNDAGSYLRNCQPQ